MSEASVSRTAGAPARRFHVPWRIRDPLLVLLWTYGAVFALAIGIMLGARFMLSPEERRAGEWVQRIFMQSPSVEIWAIVQGFLTLFFLWVRVFRRWNVNPETWFKASRLRADVREGIRLFFMAMVLSVFVVFSITALVQGLSGLLGFGDPMQAVKHYHEGLERESRVLLEADMSWFRIFVVAILMPPIEELLFRGTLYPALRKRFRPWSANLISSAVFALSHHYSFGLPNILVIGVLGAYAYERTRSLWTPIVFHVLWNLLAAGTAKPEVGWLIVPIVIGLAVWSWQGAGATENRRPGINRRIGWKVYAVLYAILTLLDIFSDLSSAWLSLIELPAWIALYRYAWKKPVGNPVFWRVYCFIYLSWFMLSWWVTTLPPETLTGWMRLLADPNSEPLTALPELFITSVAVGTLAGPMVVVLRRLGWESSVRLSNKNR